MVFHLYITNVILYDARFAGIRPPKTILGLREHGQIPANLESYKMTFVI